MNAKLLVVQGRPQGKSIQFAPGEYIFGRGQECHVRPNSEWVSRQHCMLRVTADGTFVRDLGSRNGTLINGVRLVGEVRLEHGDQLQIGPLVFETQLEPVPVPVRQPLENTGRETRILTGETASLPSLLDGDAPTTAPASEVDIVAALPPAS